MFHQRGHKYLENSHIRSCSALLVIEFSSVAQPCLTLCDLMDCNTPGFPIHHQLPELVQTHAHWVGDATQQTHPLLLPPSIFPSIRVFSHESVLCTRWPKYWRSTSASFNFQMNIQDWFLLQLTYLISLKSKWLSRVFSNTTVPKAPILQCPALFIGQLSHPYVTTGKTIALTRWTFVSIVMSLLFNMLSRFVIAFLPRSKCLLISWLQVIMCSDFGNLPRPLPPPKNHC